MNAQTKLKISYSLRGRKKSATHAHRIAESLRGKKKTDEHKKSIAAAMLLYANLRRILQLESDLSQC